MSAAIENLQAAMASNFAGRPKGRLFRSFAAVADCNGTSRSTHFELIGFPVRRLSARVRMGAEGLRPRPHMLLQVRADGQEWLADVGFGGDALLCPIEWLPGR
jgi:hypothetical protein